MHVIVVGCGRVGSGLSAQLTADGHSVAIVDRVESAFGRLPHDFAGRRLVGVGFDRDVLAAAGIDHADALAAVTNGDNSNIVIARVARETFGVERVVARIYDPNRARIYQRLGIPTVATARWTVEQVLRWVSPSGPTVEWNDATGSICVVEVVVTPTLAGQALDTLDLDEIARPIAITRLGSTALVRHDRVLQEGDVIHLAVDSARMAEFEQRVATPGGAH